jgi:hypothetical protein
MRCAQQWRFCTRFSKVGFRLHSYRRNAESRISVFANKLILLAAPIPIYRCLCVSARNAISAANYLFALSVLCCQAELDRCAMLDANLAIMRIR